MPILVVQRGHCYRRTGATGTTGEQAYATAVANACLNLLHGKGGWQVRAILADDRSSLYRGDAFVAIHCDGSTNSGARGASIGYRTPEGQRFGQAWKRAYAARGWPGFRPDNYTPALQGYYGTGTAVSVGNRRAFIAECGFLTNPQDRDLLTAAGGPTRVALAIGDALGIPTPEEDDMFEPKDRVVQDTMARRVGDMAERVLALCEEAETATGRAVPYSLHFKGLAGRVDALVHNRPTVTWGPTRGEPNRLAVALTALQAQMAALAAHPDITPAQLAAEVDKAVQRHTVSAEEIAAAIDVVQRPNIEAAVRAVLGEDNVDQADQIVDELVSRLANPNL